MFLTMFGALFKGFTTLKFICRGKKLLGNVRKDLETKLRLCVILKPL